MNKDLLFETIFKRKSIRKYDMNSLSENELAEIVSHMKELKHMDDNIKIEMKLLTEKDVKGLLFAIKAPHYLVLYSEVKEGYLSNAGFVLQQFDLFLSARGLGACWLGMTKPVKEFESKPGMEFVIVLAFGSATEALHRSDVSEFKRKGLKEITDITNYDELLEPVRLAPSATNSQPWYFTGGNGQINAYCIKLNPIKAFLYEKMNQIDMGIAICHLWIAANHLGKRVDYIRPKAVQLDIPKGYSYHTTIGIS